MKRELRGLSLLLLAAVPLLAAPAAELPRVGTIGDFPPAESTFVIAIGKDGTIENDGRVLTFPELRAILQVHARKHARGAGPSRLNALLRADRHVPWIAAQWVLIACAEAKVDRTFFAVLPEKGEDEGALALFLPQDRFPPPSVQVVLPRWTVRLVPSKDAGDPAALYEALKAELAEQPEAVRDHGTIELRAPEGAALGAVLATADAAFRAGIRRVHFYGTRIPPADADLVAKVKETPLVDAFAIKIQGYPLNSASGPMPPVERRRGGYAGNVPDVPAEEVELEEPELPEEEVVEEPIETEEVRDHGAADDGAPGGWPADEEPGAGGAVRGPGRKVRPGKPRVTEPAVENGLAWLARNQKDDGSWASGSGGHTVASTSLAVLAFLGAGNTDRGDGPYAGVVRKGLRYLIERQEHDGSFGTGKRAIYDAALATIALSEAYWMTRNPRYKRPATLGLDNLALWRYPYGGWSDERRSERCNTALTVWCVIALNSGKFAGLDVDPDGFEGARQWIDRMTDEDTGRCGYDRPGGEPFRPGPLRELYPPAQSEAPTAGAMLARVFLGEDPRTSEPYGKGMLLLLARPPRWDPAGGSIDMNYWYLGTLALFQGGGEPWRQWSKAIKAAILDRQYPEGHEDAGSWDPAGVWGKDGGRTYSTALMTMCLEVCYHYDPALGGR